MMFVDFFGAVISDAVPVAMKGVGDHYRQFGVHRGVIIEVCYPDDDLNTNNERLEYCVRVDGQIKRGAVDIRPFGGIHNYSEIVRRPTTTSGKEEKFDQLCNGDHVYVAFVGGNSELPLILGSASHFGHGQYKKIQRSDGLLFREEYNGVEITIDKDGTYKIEMVGLKDDDGNIIEGQIETDNRIVGSKIEIDGLTRKITVVDGEGNKIEMSSGVINIDTTFGSGKIIIKAGSDIELNEADSSGVRFTELETAFNELKADFNTHVHVETGGSTMVPTSTSAADISGAESSKLKLGS